MSQPPRRGRGRGFITFLVVSLAVVIASNVIATAAGYSQQEQGHVWHIIGLGALVAALPLLIVFLLTRRGRRGPRR